MKKKFDGKDGKVVFIEVAQVFSSGEVGKWPRVVAIDNESDASAYPEGTLKVEINIYPVGSGSYSSFIYTEESVPVIENAFAKIAEHFLTDGKSSYSSQDISDHISSYLSPVFPKKPL
jgi:hypothetical protein